MCNYMGNEAWVAKLEHRFHEEFSRSRSLPWITLESGKIAGEVRSAGGDGFTAGNVTFINVYEAGYVHSRIILVHRLIVTVQHRHMVPFDQPEAALVSTLHKLVAMEC